MRTIFCPNCKQGVTPVKKEWSWVVFFLFFGILYPVYRMFLSRNRCPMCKTKIR